MNDANTIGSQLKKIRKKLGLTQDEMIQGIINKAHYSRVERGLEGISSDSLLRILFIHNIDIDDFLENIKDNYRSPEDIKADKLEEKMMSAFNNSDVYNVREYLPQILDLSGHKILKYRAIIALAFLEGKLDDFSLEFKTQIVNTFNNYSNWVENIDALKLFGNCFQVFTLEQLDIFMAQLLNHYAKSSNHSDKMVERVAKICNNYLYYSYYSDTTGNNVSSCLSFLTSLDNTPQFLFYKICGNFYQLLFGGNKQEALKIKNFLIKCGYGDRVISWEIKFGDSQLF